MTGWGPFVDGLNAGELIARLRSLRAIALIFAHGHPALAEALRLAEGDVSFLRAAHAELDLLPPLVRRRVLAIYQKLARPR